MKGNDTMSTPETRFTGRGAVLAGQIFDAAAVPITLADAAMLADIVVAPPSSRSGARPVQASAAAKPDLVRCPTCATVGSLPADHKPSNIVTCSGCNAKFKAGAPTKDGTPSVGIPVETADVPMAALALEAEKMAFETGKPVLECARRIVHARELDANLAAARR